MIRFSKNEMKKASSQLREGIKENKGYLSSITMTDMSSKKHKISKMIIINGSKELYFLSLINISSISLFNFS